MQTEDQYLQLPNEQEKLFCRQYVIDMDATKAVIRAGYQEDEEGARLRGQYMLGRPELKHYIRQLLNDRSRKFEITPEAVLREIAWIAFGRTEDFAAEDVARPAQNDNVMATGPASCSVVHKDEKTGRKVVYHFNLRIKLQALMILCRHLGLFPKAGEAMPLPFPNFIFPAKGMK